MNKTIATIFNAKTLPRIRDFILWLIAITCLFFAILSTLSERTGAAGILFSAGILLIIISSLGRFESFKGLGIEAKMKDLDTKINEAENLLGHIRATAALTAEMSFQVMARIGRWDSALSKEDALSLSDGLVKELRDLGFNEDEIYKCMAPWHQTNIQDLITPIYNGIAGHIHVQNQGYMAEQQKIIDMSTAEWKMVSDLLEKNNEFLSDFKKLWKADRVQIVENFKEIIDTMPCNDAREREDLFKKLKPRVDDASYYLAHKEFKNRDEWIKIPYGH